MSAEDDLPGRMGELIRYGKIESIDLAVGRIAVRVGEIVTNKLRWIQGAAGDTHVWIRPTIGEQIVLFAPDGDIEGAIALRGVVSNAFPAIGDPDRDLIRFGDGAELAYDSASHALEVTLPGGGTAAVNAPAGIRLVGDVEIEGDVTVAGGIRASGDVDADGDIKAGSVSLKNHKHLGVTAGGAQSGIPVA